jgi:hypothetical protein
MRTGGVLALRTYVHADALDDPSFVDDALAESAADDESL